MSPGARGVEQESLKDEMRSVIEEARMVLPGIQALFGFQTAAVFDQRFDDLPLPGLWAHLLALLSGLWFVLPWSRLQRRRQVQAQAQVAPDAS